MENERLYLFTLEQSAGKGYLHCAAQTVLEATRFCGSLPGNKIVQYRLKTKFLQEGRILEMVASCMDYDIEKFRKACIRELDRQYIMSRNRYSTYSKYL